MKPVLKKSRFLNVAGLCLLVTLSTVGCSPLITIAGVALGGLSGGSSGSTPPASGVQGIGAPSLAQNANTTSPVQNHQSTEQAIHEVLNHADNQTMRESCLKSLPPEAKLPVTECTTRLSCIPGVSRPLMMRTCPADTNFAQADAQADIPVRSAYAGQEWRWDDSKGL
tara:strand:+ start:74679 stop:75182 length:504 start_codon:yes stop_codon:yes gene_type:complete